MKEFVGMVVLLVTVLMMIMVSMMSEYVAAVCEDTERFLDSIPTKYTLEEIMEKTNGEAAGW